MDGLSRPPSAPYRGVFLRRDVLIFSGQNPVGASIVPPRAPVGFVNNGIDEPVSVIPSMQNQAFFMLCDYIFLKEKHV
jgi:hypothetical protein